MRRYFSDTAILLLSSLIVNIGNYVFNLMLGRLLTPSQFSEANLLVSILLGFSFVATAYQLTAAKYPSYSTNAFAFGSLLMILFIAFAPQIQVFFQLSSVQPLWFLAIGIPFYFYLSIHRGHLQGSLAFGKLAITYQIEMWVRLLLGIGLVMVGWHSMGIALGLLGSLLITFLVSKLLVLMPTKVDNIVSGKSFFIITLLYELSQVMINNGDVWLVKHYFEAHDAGMYAALTLIGRVVYFGTWSVAMVLFPKVIEAAKKGQPTAHLFRSSFSLVTVMALIIVLGCAVMPSFVIKILLGQNYLSLAPYLWLYASLTGLFAIANVFVYYYLSLQRYLPIYFSVAAGVLQFISIIYFHNNFYEVIYCQLICTTTLVVSLILFSFFSNKVIKMKQIPVCNIA